MLIVDRGLSRHRREIGMDHRQFDRFATAMTRQRDRRAALSMGLGAGLALLGLGASQPMASKAKGNGAKRREKDKTKARLHVNDCLQNAPAIICAGTGSFYDECVSNVTFCCQRMKSGRQAGCDCLLETGWGYCTA
jgi:hypothetical protein